MVKTVGERCPLCRLPFLRPPEGAPAPRMSTSLPVTTADYLSVYAEPPVSRRAGRAGRRRAARSVGQRRRRRARLEQTEPEIFRMEDLGLEAEDLPPPVHRDEEQRTPPTERTEHKRSGYVRYSAHAGAREGTFR